VRRSEPTYEGLKDQKKWLVGSPAQSKFGAYL